MSSLDESKMKADLDNVEDRMNNSIGLAETATTIHLAGEILKPKSNNIKIQRAVDLTNNQISRNLFKANLIYSAFADKDNKLADAAAGAQFVIHTPKIYDNVINLIKNGKKDIVSNALSVLIATAPALTPIAIRYVKKKYKDKISI
jgi:hypothetical protein